MKKIKLTLLIVILFYGILWLGAGLFLKHKIKELVVSDALVPSEAEIGMRPEGIFIGVLSYHLPLGYILDAALMPSCVGNQRVELDVPLFGNRVEVAMPQVFECPEAGIVKRIAFEEKIQANLLLSQPLFQFISQDKMPPVLALLKEVWVMIPGSVWYDEAGDVVAHAAGGEVAAQYESAALQLDEKEAAGMKPEGEKNWRITANYGGLVFNSTFYRELLALDADSFEKMKPLIERHLLDSGLLNFDLSVQVTQAEGGIQPQVIVQQLRFGNDLYGIFGSGNYIAKKNYFLPKGEFNLAIENYPWVLGFVAELTNKAVEEGITHFGTAESMLQVMLSPITEEGLTNFVVWMLSHGNTYNNRRDIMFDIETSPLTGVKISDTLLSDVIAPYAAQFVPLQ